LNIAHFHRTFHPFQLSKFSIFQEELQLRQKVAERYKIMLLNCSGLTVPIVPDTYLSAWAQYSVLADSEDRRLKLQAKLKASAISTAIYYPKPLHLQTAFSDLELKEGTFPISEELCQAHLQSAYASVFNRHGPEKNCCCDGLDMTMFET
jgi:dTDP-4-amino-4,6-dideoxygalactose transaminase